MAARYQARTPTVIHEAFDDEVVIVNLDSGDYYSLSKAGSDCWNLLLSGNTVDEVVAAISAKYDGDAGEIRASIDELIQDLADETLIVPTADTPPPQSSEANGIDARDSKIPFSPPTLNRYSDMRDLLLIDPIHDVGEEGWPELKNESDESKKD